MITTVFLTFCPCLDRLCDLLSDPLCLIRDRLSLFEPSLQVLQFLRVFLPSFLFYL